MEKEPKIETKDFASTSAFIIAIVEIGKAVSSAYKKVKNFWKERSKRRKYKKIEDAVDDKDIDKINDIFDE